jgi:hypothetical protein
MLYTAVASSLLLSQPNLAVAQGDADAIVEKAIAAHGGGDNVAKLQVMQTKARGKGNFPNLGEVEFSFETYWQVPSQYKSAWELQYRNQMIANMVGVNGRVGWTSANGQVKEIPDNNFKELKEQMYAESLDKLLPLTSKSLALRSLGESKDDRLSGRSLVGIQVTAKDHRDVRLYFDKETNLLAKRENRVKDVKTGVESSQEVYYGQYKDVEGVKCWTKFTMYRDGQRFLEADITDIKFFPTLPNSLFDPP